MQTRTYQITPEQTNLQCRLDWAPLENRLGQTSSSLQQRLAKSAMGPSPIYSGVDSNLRWNLV
eukprot:5624585-Lingulodinium_polyedra.AAC.1